MPLRERLLCVSGDFEGSRKPKWESDRASSCLSPSCQQRHGNGVIALTLTSGTIVWLRDESSCKQANTTAEMSISVNVLVDYATWLSV
jgi:hypothetical protein